MSKQKKVRKISSIESTTNIKGFNAAPHLLGGLFREVLAFLCSASSLDFRHGLVWPIDDRSSREQHAEPEKVLDHIGLNGRDYSQPLRLNHR
jgi:hypothetical protein